ASTGSASRKLKRSAAEHGGFRGRPKGECMRRSIDRILVSHAGNLPRPDDLNQLLATGERERVALSQRFPSAAAGIVGRQVRGGVGVVNDGEYVKAGSYTGYINQRITGIEVQPVAPDRPPKHAG